MLQCFVITLLKWMKHKNRLAFAYYSISFWDFKSFQGVRKTWQKLKAKNYIFKRCPTIEIPFILISNPDFPIFSSNYRHRLVLKKPFPDHIFPKVSKCRTENLHFPSTGKYYDPPLTFRILEPCPSNYIDLDLSKLCSGRNMGTSRLLCMRLKFTYH